MLEIYEFEQGSEISIPLFLSSVSAGLPIEAGTDVENKIDLNEFLVKHPATTFFAKVKGSEMAEAGIQDGDFLIIDRAIKPVDGKIVIASINDELSVKYFRDIEGELYLETQNQKFLPLNIGEMEFKVLGVVTNIIHSF